MDPKKKPVPPVYFLLALVAGFLLHKFAPVLDLSSTALTYTGLGVMTLGLGITIKSARLFSKRTMWSTSPASTAVVTARRSASGIAAARAAIRASRAAV